MLKGIFLIVTEHVRQRPIRVSLAVLGVAIGVSAWLAIRLANVEVFRAFEESVEMVVGEVSLKVTGGEERIDETILQTIRTHPAVTAANPILRITGLIKNGTSTPKSSMILGLDLIEYWSHQSLVFESDERTSFPMKALLAEDSLFVGQKLATDWNLQVGDPLEVQVHSQRFQLVVQGILSAGQPRNRHVENLFIMDIAAAQGLFGLQGLLDHIHVNVASGYSLVDVAQELQALLPSPNTVSRIGLHNPQVESMVKVFQLNLTALSTVGLLVGLFLVYNTISFSVVQHRREIGILRTIGMSRSQVNGLFLTEAGIVGLIGGVLGCGLGYVMARFLVSLVGQSVTDLYTSVTIDSVSMPLVMTVEGVGVGLGVSLLGALKPSINASGTLPVRALAPGDYEVETNSRGGTWAGVAIGFFVLAAFLSLLEPVQGLPLFGYVSALLLLLGCTLLGPVAIRGLSWLKHQAMGPLLNIIGSLAIEQIARAPGRNSVTLSALAIGLAILVGVGSMIGSFRKSVEHWIDQTIIADLIVAPTTWMEGTEIDELPLGVPLEFVKEVWAIPGVIAVDPYRQIEVEHDEGTLALATRNLRLHAKHSRYLFEQGDSSQVLHKTVVENGVIVSEVLVGRLGLQVGDHLELISPKGKIKFPIMGVFFDYATDGGKVVMDESLYHRYWTDHRASVLAVYVKPEVSLDVVRRRVEEVLTSKVPVTTISQSELKTDILKIFDRTFRITYVLELIALTVAMLGIVNTLVTAILERQREIATLRAIGASMRQIRRLVFWESGLLAALGTILGLGGGEPFRCS